MAVTGLGRRFDLDDAYLADLKAEIIDVHRLAVDQDGTMLVWIGDMSLALTAAPARPAALNMLEVAPPTAYGQAPALVSTALLEVELYRLQGVLLLAQSSDNHATAETCWSQALALARRQQAKAWELRTAMSLSRLWQQQGKQEDARQLLAKVYDWFTEGFETADLQEARALLGTLAS